MINVDQLLSEIMNNQYVRATDEQFIRWHEYGVKLLESHGFDQVAEDVRTKRVSLQWTLKIMMQRPELYEVEEFNEIKFAHEMAERLEI